MEKPELDCMISEVLTMSSSAKQFKRGRRLLGTRDPAAAGELNELGPNPIPNSNQFNNKTRYLFLPQLLVSVLILSSSLAVLRASGQQQRTSNTLPDLVSATSDEPIVAVIGQDAFVSCVAKNLQNYTIIWRYTNDASAPGDDPRQQQAPAAATTTSTSSSSPTSKLPEDMSVILTAGRQRVTSDDRISVIQSHDTWLLKVSNVRPSDTGTYICQTNSEPKVRVPRILSVIKPAPGVQTDAPGECSWI